MKAQIRLVVCVFTLCSVLGGALGFAASDSKLSAEDEHAYQNAHASWRHMAEVNAEAGLPPLGDEPRRSDFVGFDAAQRTEILEA